jgi:septal ring factor EnvC (AmiA/AmiB activator)
MFRSTPNPLTALKFPTTTPAIERLRSGILLALALLLAVAATAQNKSELETKRKKLTREIEVTGKLLKKTTRDKAATYDRFVTLQNQIERRESLIETIENEIVASDESIARTTVVVTSLESDIEQMKAEYGRMVRAAYRRKMLVNPLVFILSAESLNQAFRRFLFLRKYDRFRKGQAEAIAFTKDILTKKIAGLEDARREKEELLASMQGQRSTLTIELSDKNFLLETLNKDEERLRQDLQAKQAARSQLDAAIEKVIAAEVIKKAEEDSKRRAAALAAEKARAAEAAKNAAAAKAPAPTTPTPTVSTPTVANKPTVSKPAASPPAVEPATQPTTSPASTPVATTAKKETTPAENLPSEAADDDRISLQFRRQRGKLTPPVEGGFIARRFGRQQHPTIKNIEITNNGIDIRTDEAAPVHAVFEGKVAGVQYIPGHDYTVILQHGNYYTVYSNLSETSLTKGASVGAGQTIGRVSINPVNGAAELHFELWREKERLNPAAWIK